MVLTVHTAAAQQCRFYLANNSGSNYGFNLVLKSQADSNGICPLSSVNLELAVGDGTNYHHVMLGVPPAWQTGIVYTAQGIIMPTGSFQLFTNGQSLGTNQAFLVPAHAALFGSLASDDPRATAGYLVSQISLQVSNGLNSVTLVPNNNNPVPIASLLMSGPAAWQTPLGVDTNQPITITAAFRFDALPQNTNQFAPFIDAYGQAAFSSWSGKVATTNDLQVAIVEEQNWSATNGPILGLDIYGGSTLAGWSNPPTGWFTCAFHGNRWWLISPLGNPLFYLGITGIYDNVTPVTGRENIFSNLPVQPDFSAAYSTNAWGEPSTQTNIYVSFDIANQIRKYGSSWKTMSAKQAVERILNWGFGGVGKEGGLPNLPRSPILDHNYITNVVSGGHPDIFDTNILYQLSTNLASQMGSDITNRYLLGWSVGNEKKEIITDSEVTNILLLGASVAAKRAFVDYAKAAIYNSNFTNLAAAWDPGATNKQNIYAAPVVPPTNDVEMLRQFYEFSYYSNLNAVVKSIDSNHLYFGSWILANYAADWPIAASNCDVVGIDDFSPDFSPDLLARIAATGKPVLLGAYSYPSDYLGMRGFGWFDYLNVTTISDSASGDQYTQRILGAATNACFVGAEWFEYRDEPPCGRGYTDGTGYLPGSLVVGENIASGLVDVTDRPKYDLVNKVRTANMTAWKNLGLLVPQIITTDSAFGVVSNAFGFHISGQPGQVVVVERSYDLTNWRPNQTNTLAGSVLYYSDTSLRRNAQRFYRVRYQ
jgi:hypothetical protein